MEQNCFSTNGAKTTVFQKETMQINITLWGKINQNG